MPLLARFVCVEHTQGQIRLSRPDIFGHFTKWTTPRRGGTQKGVVCDLCV